MLTIEQCKKLLSQNGIEYTDEETIQIRDWLYHIADIAIDAYTQSELKQIQGTINKKS